MYRRDVECGCSLAYEDIAISLLCVLSTGVSSVRFHDILIRARNLDAGTISSNSTAPEVEGRIRHYFRVDDRIIQNSGLIACASPN